MTPDCELVMPGAPPLRGEAQIRGMFEAYVDALPDFRAETLVAVESVDTYAAETRFAGTHDGPLVTPHGAIPPSGRQIGWQSADIIRFRGGKIASWHVYHDPSSLLTQFGVLGLHRVDH
jgi:ketosteroid isomerase-like protein